MNASELNKPRLRCSRNCNASLLLVYTFIDWAAFATMGATQENRF
jgi:hypothetical protein